MCACVNRGKLKTEKLFFIIIIIFFHTFSCSNSSIFFEILWYSFVGSAAIVHWLKHFFFISFFILYNWKTKEKFIVGANTSVLLPESIWTRSKHQKVSEWERMREKFSVKLNNSMNGGGGGGDWGGGGKQQKSFVFTDFFTKCVIQGCQSFYIHTPPLLLVIENDKNSFVFLLVVMMMTT